MGVKHQSTNDLMNSPISMTPSGQDLLLHLSSLNMIKMMAPGISRRVRMYYLVLAHPFLPVVTRSKCIEHDTLTKPI